MQARPLEILFLVVIAAAGSALGLAWRRTWTLSHSPAFRERKTKLPLLTTTASYLFFLLCWSFPRALGSAYNRRLTTIYINFGASAAILIISLFIKTPLRWTVAIAAAALALIWLIVGAWSSAV